jgi:hypothetical protein
MAYTKLVAHASPGASVEEISRGSVYRLSLPSGKEDKFRIAQLDDYAKIIGRRFPHYLLPTAPPDSGITLSLTARTSSGSIPGTWGFGFWNDPIVFSLGTAGNPLRLPALPNAVWFFGAAKENYLSFKGTHRPERSGTLTKDASPTGSARDEEAANGFIAQTFRSPKFHPLLIPAGIALPFSRKSTRRLLGKVIGEDGIALRVDVTEWHRYCLDWGAKRVVFRVDDLQVFESQVSPHPPLGLVIWIDNQYAAFTPEGKIGFGFLANPEPAWLEIKDLEIRKLETGDT